MAIIDTIARRTIKIILIISETLRNLIALIILTSSIIIKSILISTLCSKKIIKYMFSNRMGHIEDQDLHNFRTIQDNKDSRPILNKLIRIKND